MLKLYTKIQTLRATRDQGVTSLEYAVLAAAIISVLVVAGWLLYDAIQGQFQNVCTTVGNGGC
jgi:Flp pilus assembly pilin Flp